MKKLVYLLVSLLCLVIGFAGPKGVIEGIFKGLSGVFFILFYISMLLDKQPKDKTTSH